MYYAYKLQPPYMYINFSLVCVAGPTELTVVKFWQMVWEYQLNTLVMLTRCVEDSKVATLQKQDGYFNAKCFTSVACVVTHSCK